MTLSIKELENIKKEAYNQGYKVGYKDGYELGYMQGVDYSNSALEERIAELEEALEELRPKVPDRPKGKWIMNHNPTNLYGDMYRCSVCSRTIILEPDFKFKPCEILKQYPYCHCGADMRGE